MAIKLRFLAAVLLLAATLGPYPASCDDELATLINGHIYEMTFADGRLSGPGATWLLQQAADAQFFMIGEQHATADIALLSSALYRKLNGLGFTHAAIEVGPWSTRIAERMLRDGDAFERYLTKDDQMLTFPFLFFKEEVEFARTVIALSEAGSDVLWGVDQEFVAGARPLLDHLATLARTHTEKQAVAGAQALAAANLMLLGRGDDAEWQSLIDAFSESESAEARHLVGDIVISRRIYAPFTGRGGSVYSANEERERYMKTWFQGHLQRELNASGKTPKVFLKFGANHVAYGHSPTHVITLGTFVNELAWAHGQRAFNVHLDCRGGLARDPLSGEASPCESYFLSPDSSLGAYLHDDRITLIDLASLRTNTKLWNGFDDMSKQLIWAYDAIVAIPDTRPATVVE